MRAVITVLGKDSVGILAKVSGKCANFGVNITEVTQSVLEDLFAMIMMADISGLQVDFSRFHSEMQELGTDEGLQIHVMHETIFNSMHRI